MLLNCRMASIPCSSRHSISYMKDIQHLLKKQQQSSMISRSQPTTGLQYFNMRVTQRLHRYRSLKRQWQEVATSVQNNTSLSPKSKSNNEPKPYCINDYINSTPAVAVAKDYNDKHLIELDPLHTRIQQDLIKLRKFIKAKQRKSIGNTTLKTTITSGPSGETTSISTAFDDQENQNITIVRKASSVSKLKPLDRVKIAGSQMRPPMLPKSESIDSGVGSASNASSTCSQYSKQQQQIKSKRSTNNNKTFNIYNTRLNPPAPLLFSDSIFYRSSSQSKKKFNTSVKISSQNISSKQILSSRLPIPIFPIEENKRPSFTKQEIPLPPIQHLSDSDEPTTRSYTYASSTSASIPCSTALKRNTSLLPILLESSSCIGIRPRENQQKKVEYDLKEDEDQEETDDNNEEDDYYYLLNYNHLINRLPKPVISIHPRYGQDEYGILFEQLDHIRETMPDTNIYDDFARIA